MKPSKFDWGHKRKTYRDTYILHFKEVLIELKYSKSKEIENRIRS